MEAVHISERLPGVLAGLLDRINAAPTPGEVQTLADYAAAMPAAWRDDAARRGEASRREDCAPEVRRVGA